MDKKFTVELTLDELKKILAALAERPYRQVVDLITKIKGFIKE